jgi:hypothetical protein
MMSIRAKRHESEDHDHRDQGKTGRHLNRGEI